MQNPIPITLDFLPSRNLFEAQPPAELFHYTDLDGVAGILGTRSLWLSKISTLNDTSEISLAVRQFKAEADEAAGHLDEDAASFLREAAAQLDSFKRTNICVGSFSEERDHLNQWRSYANDGRGIALGFDSHELRALAYQYDVRLVRCIYDPRLHTRITKDLVALLVNGFRAAAPQTSEARRELLALFNTTFLLAAPVIKDHHFGLENEWRLVSMPRSPDDRHLTAILTGNLASVRFVLPLCGKSEERSHIISSVTVGPTQDPENVADAVDVLARHQGFDIPAVRFSRVPYRPKR
jgi:DUF2971 family protein